MPNNQLSSGQPDPDDLARIIIESATDYAVYTIDSVGTATSWNSGAERLFGYTSEDMVGRSADRIFTREDQEAGEPEEERRVAAMKGRVEDERWHRRKDGTRFWASGLLMPLRQVESGFVKICRDLSRQHLTNQKLKESEARFRVLATNIPQLVFLTKTGWDAHLAQSAMDRLYRPKC